MSTRSATEPQRKSIKLSWPSQSIYSYVLVEVLDWITFKGVYTAQSNCEEVRSKISFDFLLEFIKKKRKVPLLKWLRDVKQNMFYLG